MTQIDIDKTEIKGINLKTLRTTIGWALSSMVTIVSMSIWLTSTMQQIKANQEKSNEINTLQLRTLDVRLTNLELELSKQRERIEELKADR